MNREWTEEEIEILRRDRAAKIPVPVTAAKLNRPVPATYLRARMIGTQVQKHQAWGNDEVERLRRMVMADPPMTDKRIAEELRRTVTQVRWKMQDLGLIGVRDLSKLARATSAGSHRPTGAKPLTQPRSSPVSGAPRKMTPAHTAREQHEAAERPRSTTELVEVAVAQLAMVLDGVLKSAVAEAEKEMMQAAMAAIAEKKAIDERLTKLTPPSAVRSPDENARASNPSSSVRERPSLDKSVTSSTRDASPAVSRKKPAKETKAPARQLAMKPISRPAASPAPKSMTSDPAPKIIVLDAPAPARADPPALEPSQVSGRGGWKSVRRDPAKVAAQARSKPANRADAVDLAHAAQTAIEQFIAQRGVTRNEVGGPQALVTRLQARGYVVISDGDGWVIDQRHRVKGGKELEAFAAARGISLDAAA